MPNRSASEREPEYHELISGHSLHKGMIVLSAESPQITESEMAQQQEPSQPPSLRPSPTFGDQLREWASHRFHNRKK